VPGPGVVRRGIDRQGVGHGEVELIKPTEPALPLLSWLRNTETLAKTEGGDAVGQAKLVTSGPN